MHPLEDLLRAIDRVSPQPWFPREQAARAGVSLESVNCFLEQLWLDGLLEKGGTDPQMGTGLVLSPKGKAVLSDPEAMARLCAGEPLGPDDRGGTVRAILRKQAPPIVTRILLGANIAVFLWGLYVANGLKVARDFLTMFGQVPPAVAAAVSHVLHETGSVQGFDLIRGHWWRLLSCCFVHVGLLHLACNMYVLRGIGRNAEQMWGRWRYLVIYILSGLGGSFLAMAYKPTNLAGASGALCGLIGAEGIWLLLNGRYLPRRVTRRWGGTLVINLVLLAVFSSMANVSALAHTGGLVVGAAAALLLNWQRFGPAGLRWLALLPLAAVPLVGFELIQWQRTVNPMWHTEEKYLFDRDFRPVVKTALDKAKLALRYEGPPSDALPFAIRVRGELEQVQASLQRIGPFGSQEAEDERTTALAKLAFEIEALDEKAKKLEAKAEKEKQREAVEAKDDDAFVKQFRAPIQKAANDAEALIKNVLQPLALMQPVLERDPVKVKQSLQDLGKQRATLDDLAAALAKTEYHSETAKAARDVGRDYVRAEARWLEAYETPLRTGAEWKEAEVADAKKHVEQKQSDWRDLFERK